MEISGLVKTSLIDYPGKVAAVVFTQGCNFRCGFCHNPDLIPVSAKGTQVEAEIFEYLEKRKNVLDGVVITGGEPMVQADLLDRISKIKAMGLLVKLDTNGSNPQMLKKAIADGLVDYIAMDIKGKLSDYEKICGYKHKQKIIESIDAIKSSGIDYEFRTTVLPYYHNIDDFREIGMILSGARKYTIQGFRPQITLSKELSGERAYDSKELSQIADVMKGYVKEVVIHENLA